MDEAEFQKADLHEGLDSTLTLVHHELRNRAIVLKDYGNLPLVYCSPNQLNQVFMNLFINASQAIDGKGEIRISTRADDAKVCIRIADNGKGILPEHLPKIFDPGFTTKGTGVGTGLGLSICYNIIQKHKGSITVESEPGKGTEFTITLPVQPENELAADLNTGCFDFATRAYTENGLLLLTDSSDSPVLITRSICLLRPPTALVVFSAPLAGELPLHANLKCANSNPQTLLRRHVKLITRYSASQPRVLFNLILSLA